MKYYAKVLTTKNNHVTKTTSNSSKDRFYNRRRPACLCLFLRGKELPTTPIRTPIL